jgi:hypothetical protein
MPVNDFKAFATGENANVLSQEEYEELEALGGGFQSGIARSEQLNKVWRQASIIASVVARFMAEKSGDDVKDDGDLEKLQESLLKALLNNATTQLDGRYLKAASNLADLTSVEAARGNMELKGAALLDVGTASGTVAAGNDSRIVNAAQRGNNLSDLTDKGVALNNINAVSRATTINGRALTGNINVTSQDIFNGQAIQIPSGANLNSYQTPGIYFQPANANAAAGSNYPEAQAGTLLVFKNAGVTQIYIVYNTSRIYSRSIYSTGSWTGWAKDYNSLNKPSAGDVGALSIIGGALSGQLNVASIGAGSYASQYNVGAPLMLTASKNETSSTFWPMIKQKLTTSGSKPYSYVVSTGALTAVSENISWIVHIKGSAGQECSLKFSAQNGGRLTLSEQVIPGNYGNFDARYQAKNTASKAVNGWHKDTTTGVITQWGYVAPGWAGFAKINFPIAFPSTCTNVLVSITGDGGESKANYSSVQKGSVSRTGAAIGYDKGGAYWTAKGY